MNRKEMAFYLRCMNAEIEKQPRKCGEDCPYFYWDEIREKEFMALADKVDEFGVGWCKACDCDRIVEDAAKLLEEKG